MLDKERILSKIDDMNSYPNELRQIVPENFSDYQSIEKYAVAKGYFSCA